MTQTKNKETKSQILKEIAAFGASWNGYLEKSWAGLPYVYEKTKGAGSDNVVWMWKEAYEAGFPNLQGSYWCAIWQFMKYVHVIGLEKTQKLFHQSWFINCQSLYETFKALEKQTGKAFVYTTPAPGRIYLHWNGTRHNHTEDVIAVSADGKTFWTNGGNTSVSGAVPNGGGIYHRKEYTSAVCQSRGDHFIELDWESLIKEENNKTAPLSAVYEIKTGKSGLTVCTDTALHIRSAPKTGGVIGTLKPGEAVFPSGKTFLLGDPWYYLPKQNGWISAKYLDGGWVYESSISSSNKWWYIHKGYTCTVDNMECIDGTYYLFDEEGYMLENTSVCFEINRNGEMIRRRLSPGSESWQSPLSGTNINPESTAPNSQAVC